MKEERKAYEEKLEAQLREWDGQIALLRSKADNAESEAKTDYYKTIEALRHKHDEAGTKLHELKSAGDESWEDLKNGAEEAWADVTTALERVIAKLP